MSTATDLQSLVKVGAVMFAGAFFGSLTLNGGIPTTLVEAKAVLVPALGAAIAAEIIYLRKVFAAALPPGTTSSSLEVTKVMTKEDIK